MFLAEALVCFKDTGMKRNRLFWFVCVSFFICNLRLLFCVFLFVFSDVMAHCARVKPILDLVHKIISTDWTVSDCLLPLTSRIYMLLQRYANCTHDFTEHPSE